MLGFLSKILRGQSHPLNKIYISQVNLRHNYQYLASLKPGIKVAPVLKSNAYGHGIDLVGQILEEEDVPFFCVDSLLEAYQLRKVGVKKDILIMGYIDPASLKKKLNFQFAVYNLELARVINRYQKNSQIHVFVDTGMHREGVPLECPILNDKYKIDGECCLRHFLKELKNLEDIKIVGLMSHLAVGNKPNNPLTKQQLQNFSKAVKICQEEGIELKWKHLGGSNALLHLNSSVINLVRAGLSIYGLDPDGKNPKLKPCLKLVTKVVQIKQISMGDKVGYNASFTARKTLTIGVLPIGYYDGVDRRLSNKGVVLKANKSCPIIGMLSMNMTTIDLSQAKEPKVGDEIVIFSDNPKDPNSFKTSANLCQTTPYVLFVNLGHTTRREIIQ
jgi:alanine racemase